MPDDYEVIVVGSDGSKSSMLAVERAARLAAAFGAELVIATAYYDSEADVSAAPRQDSVIILGNEQAEKNLEGAASYAREVGAGNVRVAARAGTPVEALMAVVNEYGADLLVVGNRGINTLTGRLLGSVPADVARQSDCDVMIVHTVK
ncbi:Nucleotide-binding universal stress protein, UspA family [Corynebacterium mycetoides]|uniref:Nucleotide-binding universal stress protein, UspA family n=1 Tax=Corynebacterium mycetoides TaxID=38302 RepID=A0A1G9M5U0_9CORY|nr:universal stress protein [Corynebacterium mycetoides]SDL69586.1 Nucleotide-binding universal stress protein, UspA family [Corynebacterium mycetoides]